jgi:hypothetical protein
MFNIVKQVINWEDSLYIIKRIIKESSIKEEFIHSYKEDIKADNVLRKNGHYFFVEKITDVQPIEEEPIRLEQTTED